MRALLIGNYGVGNLGDEALREYFLKEFPEAEWVVVCVSCHPKPRRGMAVPRLPFGLRSFFTTPWHRTVREFFRCDAVVFGGGSLFTDIESPKACVLWGWHALVAKLFGRPFFLAFQGIGPFRTGLGKRIARWAVRHAAHISVRDEASLERVKLWGRGDVVLAFDPVLSAMSVPARHGEPDEPSRRLLVVIPRDNSGDDFVAAARALWESGRFADLRVLRFKPDDDAETAVTNRLLALGGKDVSAVAPIRSLGDLPAALSGAAFVLTHRYHGGIAALALGIPYEAMAQGPDDKLASLQNVSLSSEALRQRVREGERALRRSLFDTP